MVRRRVEAALFVGPSLRPADLAHLPPELEILPPAAQGDLYRVSQFAPKMIGLVDGFFHSMPAPWHKEILWALERGVIVMGASSIGALRAAELAPFGMIGIGQVYHQFVDGVLEDDDDVAVVHGPAEFGFPALSEAMVNIRATMRQAVDAGVIDAEIEDAMLNCAKARPFWERTRHNLYTDAANAGLAPSPSILDWLDTNWVDLKRHDARQLVDRVREALDDDWNVTRRSAHSLEHTTMWEEVRQTHWALDDTPVIGLLELIEELSLKGQGFARDAGVFPLVRPNFDAWADVHADPGNPLDQKHDVWMRELVNKLKGVDAYDGLLLDAINKKRSIQAFGPAVPVEHPEAVLASHFKRIGEFQHWMRNGSPAIEDPDFWNELDLYSGSLGLTDSEAFIRIVIRDHQFGTKG